MEGCELAMKENTIGTDRLLIFAVLGMLALSGGCNKPSFKPEFSTPENALQSLEDAYRTKNPKNVLICKDFALEAKFFLGRSRSVSEDVLIQHTDMLKARFEKQLAQGFPEWNGVTARILSKEELPGDMVVITEELDLPDGKKMTQRIFVGKSERGWKVLMPYSDKRKDAWLESQKALSESG